MSKEYKKEETPATMVSEPAVAYNVPGTLRDLVKSLPVQEIIPLTEEKFQARFAKWL